MRRMLDLKDCKLDLSLTSMSNLDHMYGPKYLRMFPVMYGYVTKRTFDMFLRQESAEQ